MNSKTKMIIFSLFILVLSISAASAHENIIADGNDAINDGMISIGNLDDDSEDGWDDSLDDLDVGFDDLDDEDWDDDYGDDDSDDFDDWDDEDWDDDYGDDDSNDFDDWDDEDWDDDYGDDDSDDFDDWDDEGGCGNYTNSSIRLNKLISYYLDGPCIAYKTTSSLKNRTCADSNNNSEDDNEDICNDDSQEGFGLEDLQSCMTTSLGASASFEVPDTLSENQVSVSKSINQDQNLLDDKNETSVGGTDDKNYDTIAFSSNNDLDVLGLLVSLLLCIILLI